MLERISVSRRAARFILQAAAIVCAIAFAGPRCAAAGPSYTFSQTIETYKDLDNPTRIPYPMHDSVYRLDLGGEVFRFFGKPFAITGTSRFEIASAGFLRVWDDSTVMVVDGLLISLDSLDPTAGLSYLLDGPPDDRTLKIEWKHVGFPNGLPTDFANFQIWVHQKSQDVEIRIGPNTVAGPNVYTDGPFLGAFICPSSFELMTEKLWITGDPSKPVIDRLKNLDFKPMRRVPDAGTVYHLTYNAVASASPVRKTTGMIDISPLPVHEYLALHREDKSGELRISVTDMGGATVLQRTLPAGSAGIDVSSLPSGSYLLSIDDGNGVLVRKMVKE